MSPDAHGSDEGSDVGRRRFLTALGATTALGLAGCQDLRSQSFEASQVTLSQSSMDDLGLGEVASEALRLEGEGLDGNVQVSITSHAAVYSRALGLGGR